jgi:hypothetical protein
MAESASDCMTEKVKGHRKAEQDVREENKIADGVTYELSPAFTKKAGRLVINAAQTWKVPLFITSETLAIAGVVGSRKSKGWWKIAMLVLAIVTALVDGINSILQTEESYRFAAIWKLCWEVVKLLWPLVKAVWARFHPAKVLDADDGYVDRVLCDGGIIHAWYVHYLSTLVDCISNLHLLYSEFWPGLRWLRERII